MRHLVLAFGLLAMSPAAAQAPGGGMPAVMVAEVRLEALADMRTFAGRVRSPETVTLIARVEGFLGPRQFEDGMLVEKGQTLFLIEPEAYQASVEEAVATVASREAEVELAQIDFDRQQQLVERNAVAQSELDRARANLKEAEAALTGARASLRRAELNLSYTTIAAPIAGRISAAAYSEGELVGPSQGDLAEIVALDPMRVAFPVPSEVLLEVQRQGRTAEDVLVRLLLADGRTYEPVGRIIFSDVRADSSTDTIVVTAEIPNPRGILVDGQLVEVIVEQKVAQPRLVIPQEALLLDQQGAYVLTVDAEDTVRQTRFTPGAQRGRFLVVEDGLEEGMRVIVSGIQKVRPGVQVTAEMADGNDTSAGN